MSSTTTVAADTWTDVCKIDDLISHIGNCVLFEGHQVAIFSLHDEEKIYAVQNYDPKGKANVLSRGVIGDIDGEIVIISPIHKERYNLETGLCLDDANVSLRCFAVRNEQGVVQMKISSTTTGT